MEQIFRVQTVKLVRPGLSSVSPDRRRKVKRKKDYDSVVQSVRTGEE